MENRENGVSTVPQTMLIVDDDFIHRSIMENIFSSYYRIEEAEDWTRFCGTRNGSVRSFWMW